jgi:hypothetical protein
MLDREGTIECWLAYGPDGRPYLAVCADDPDDAWGILADAWWSNKTPPETKAQIINDMKIEGWVLKVALVEELFPGPSGHYYKPDKERN